MRSASNVASSSIFGASLASVSSARTGRGRRGRRAGRAIAGVGGRERRSVSGVLAKKGVEDRLGRDVAASGR